MASLHMCVCTCLISDIPQCIIQFKCDHIHFTIHTKMKDASFCACSTIIANYSDKRTFLFHFHSFLLSSVLHLSVLYVFHPSVHSFPLSAGPN